MKDTITDNRTEPAGSSYESMISIVEQMQQWTAVKTGSIRVMNAEMQLLRAIGRHDGISVGEAAKELGITKGAVSQTISRLSCKGSFIRKEQDPDNASRLRLHLDTDGRKIHEAHERYHREMDDLEQELLRGASPEERAFLERYLRTVCGKLNQEHEILSLWLEQQ